MPTKKGNLLHSEGNMLPFDGNAERNAKRYAGAIATALRQEVDATGRQAKDIMRWTGASERAVKGWLAGERGPSGEHLIALMAHSDAVLAAVMTLASRQGMGHSADLIEAHRLLCGGLSVLERAINAGRAG